MLQGNRHGAPQSRSDQDGTPLTRITDEEEKLEKRQGPIKTLIIHPNTLLAAPMRP
jgi:hypothetical protein